MLTYHCHQLEVRFSCGGIHGNLSFFRPFLFFHSGEPQNIFDFRLLKSVLTAVFFCNLDCNVHQLMSLPGPKCHSCRVHVAKERNSGIQGKCSKILSLHAPTDTLHVNG